MTEGLDMSTSKFTEYNFRLKDNSRDLRKNMTKQERRLWYNFLREHNVRFNRQRPIGEYIVDFYSSKAKLIIELDGSQHYSKEGKAYDERRSLFFKSLGLEVIRFSNLDIDTNFEGVCHCINKVVYSRITTPQSPTVTAPLAGEPKAKE